MQVVKPKFSKPDNSHYSSLQSCLRTIDLDLVGDGTHLTYFEMIGSFSFGNNDYASSAQMWHNIVTELKIPVTHVTVHPTQKHHEQIWSNLGYMVQPDEGCTWSDGEIGGFCCELFVKDLEIGNLVNPLEHSVDVGFGLERLVQVIEGKNRVDETSLFNQNWHPIVRDHVRSVTHLLQHQIVPGNIFIFRKSILYFTIKINKTIRYQIKFIVIHQLVRSQLGKTSSAYQNIISQFFFFLTNLHKRRHRQKQDNKD
jgi:alanyl-tRNA synthetase